MQEHADSFPSLKILTDDNSGVFTYLLSLLSTFTGVRLEAVGGGSPAFDLTYGTPPGLPEVTPHIPKIDKYDGGNIPLLDDYEFILSGDIPLNADLGFDIVTAMRFWLLDEAHADYGKDMLDEHGRIPALNSLQYRLKILEKPLVNRYVLVFSRWLEKHFDVQTRPFLPEGCKAAVILSHDVDQVSHLNIRHRMKMLEGALRRMRVGEAAARLAGLELQFLKKAAGSEEDFWMFPHVMAAEKKLGLRSTWFFASRSNLDDKSEHALDVDYTIDTPRFAELFRTLRAEGFEIGLHASYNAAAAELFSEEKKLLEKFTGGAINGLRHHFWRVGHPFWNTLQAHAAAGFEYDTSLGFNDRPGLRLSCALPFRPYDHSKKTALPILQIPSAVMDGNYFYQKGMSAARAVSEMRSFVEELKRHRGVAAINWHNRTSYPGNATYAELGKAYLEIIEMLAGDQEIFVGSFRQFIDALPPDPCAPRKEAPAPGVIVVSNEHLYGELQRQWARHDTRYADPAVWQRRIFESPTGRTVGVTALADGRWAGGFLTIPMPVRGPQGQKLHGGKMEVMITSPDFRGRSIIWEDGGSDKVSVAVSRALISASMQAGFEVIFGIPTVPAFNAHKPAGHGVIVIKRRPMILVLQHGFAFGGGQGRSLLVKRAAGEALWAGQAAARLLNRAVGARFEIRRVSRFSRDIETLDDEIAAALPSITLQRRADYLNWRFGDDPSAVLLELRQNGSLSGMLVGRLPRPDSKRAVLGDLLVRPDDIGPAMALIGAFAALAREAGTVAVSYISYGSGRLAVQQRLLLSGCGFLQYAPAAEENWIVDAGNGQNTTDYLSDSDWSANSLFLDI